MLTRFRRLTPIWGIVIGVLVFVALVFERLQVDDADAVVVILFFCLLGLSLWRIPEALAAPREKETGSQATERVERESAARNALGQLLTGVAAVVGIYFLWGQLVATNATLKINQQGQVVERFTRAVDQLGSLSAATRLGGIYALEELAADPQQFWPVVQVLSAQVREIAPWPDRLPMATPQSENGGQKATLISVLARLSHSLNGRSQSLDFHSTDLQSVRFDGAFLRAANFRGSSLREARLSQTVLEEAYFRPLGDEISILTGATLLGANLKGALLHCADLSGPTTTLTGATLIGATLTEANLRGANLSGAHLQNAVFVEADLRDVPFGRSEMEDTVLDGAYLQGADLSEVMGLTQSQLELACTDATTQLPSGLRHGPGISGCRSSPPTPCDQIESGGGADTPSATAFLATPEG